MSAIQITLNKIKAHSPCQDGWERLITTHGHLQPDEEFPLADALQACTLDDVLWSMRCLPEHDNLWRKYSVWCAAQVQHLMTDERSKAALVVAWRHAEGRATYKQLIAAEAAYLAADAARAADMAAARAADMAAAEAASCAARAADAAADMDAAEAAEAARAAAARAAYWAAEDAARAADFAAARAAAKEAQKAKLIEILNAGEWVGECPVDLGEGE